MVNVGIPQNHSRSQPVVPLLKRPREDSDVCAHGVGELYGDMPKPAESDDGNLLLGANHYYSTSDPETFKQLNNTFDLIVNTSCPGQRPNAAAASR
jgi:hypothetical protein